MKTRGLLMKELGVNATLAGRKTQTRRKVALAPFIAAHDTVCHVTGPYGDGIWKFHYTETLDPMYTIDIRCPYGIIGDHLYIRETLRRKNNADGMPGYITYRADCTPVANRNPNELHPEYGRPTWPWKRNVLPSIHMPKWASRILLEITDVRVERIQDISLDDIKAEGVSWHEPISSGGKDAYAYYRNFEHIWDSIYAKQGYGWSVNPWVWAVTFERLEGV